MGLCGPLQLSPGEAVITDSAFNGCFMLGRFSSVILAYFIKPRHMTMSATAGCAVGSIVLIAFGTVSKYGLYIGTGNWELIIPLIFMSWTILPGIVGYFVSWQFGSTYSWVAKKIDITGRIAPLFYFGCGFGSAVMAPLSGFVFTSASGPVGMLYLALATVTFQACVYAGMWLLARRTVSDGIVMKNM